MRLKLSRCPKGPRKFPSVLKKVLTKLPPIKKKRFKCIGGPWNGRYIKLSICGKGLARTLEFSVPSYENSQKGLYCEMDDLRDCVIWRIL